MIDAIRSEDPIRSKIEALGTTLSLPTVRKALGVLEGAHASDKRFGADDVMDIRIYEPGDEAKRIDWKTSARVGRPMVVQRERPSTSRAWLLLDVRTGNDRYLRFRRTGSSGRSQRPMHVRGAQPASW